MEDGSGRCLCGAVRYRFRGAPVWQMHCHCESCRRATGAGFASFLSVRREDLAWSGERRSFASSAGVLRSFCPVCGTPLSYETDRRPDETDLYAATLDKPETYAPTAHFLWNEHVPWIVPGDGLPRIRVPRQLAPDEDSTPVLALIRAAFAELDGRIDPPSSASRLAPADIARQAAAGEVWLIEEGARPVACVFLTPGTDALGIGKLAVEGAFRRQGLARQLVDHAAERARAMGLPALELQTRVELTGNHAAFRAMGFAQTGATAHPGHDRPTSLTFRRAVGPAPE